MKWIFCAAALAFTLASGTAAAEVVTEQCTAPNGQTDFTLSLDKDTKELILKGSLTTSDPGYAYKFTPAQKQAKGNDAYQTDLSVQRLSGIFVQVISRMNINERFAAPKNKSSVTINIKNGSHMNPKTISCKIPGA